MATTKAGKRSSRFYSVIVTTLVAVLAVAYSFIPSETPPAAPTVIGRNNTVLFLTNHEYGLSNAHLATAAQLAQSRTHMDIHYASFAPMKKKLDRLWNSSSIQKSYEWHPLVGTSYAECFAPLVTDNATTSATNPFAHPPRLAGLAKTAKTVSAGVCPWTAEQAWEIYQQIHAIIEEVNPAVVVLDQTLSPAWDAAKTLNRAYTILSPNDLATMFAETQPRGEMFWKYPSWGSGLSFPVPWQDIPLNIYLRIRVIAKIIASDVWSKRKFLAEKGVTSSLSMADVRLERSPWIAMSVPEASIPLTVTPESVTECGAIFMEMGRAEDNDAELAAWAKRRPTVLISLGTIFAYDSTTLLAMAVALDAVLEATNTQVLWKVGDAGIKFQDDRWEHILRKWTEDDRLRVVKWLEIEPASLLMTGDVTLFVHHGGASSYYDAVIAGVPHLVLPQWADHYTFAAAAEYREVGIWPNKDTAPGWEPKELEHAFMKLLSSGEGEIMRQKAADLGKISRGYGGRKCAADIVAAMAGQGR